MPDALSRTMQEARPSPEAIHLRLDRLQEQLAQAQRQTREQLRYLRADYADALLAASDLDIQLFDLYQ